MQEIAADAAIALGEAGPFGAGDYLPEAGGTLGEFQGAAFALEEGHYSPVVETRRGLYILRLLSSEADPREPPSPEQAELVLSAARGRLQQEWFAMLVRHAEVKDYRQRFYIL
jgi:parvulin-like peptidyl-prolyl isomerase